ncbi:Oidioi.mRNA.OKI2018_I69.chr1.g118.t1.cds [Oikopleura dioica]|uniref:Oidioi.mRNA.OKI2018_I69.chr1.g118.t1.cds n=1 Tax=Oikopleura dioica TaxID=34765 RepID=A0ABN7SIV9_OIKDI|nr:Oidioi.mRNA.OKI2018_I69.chr1.g118.t1.cds [Oikopleura dioica]
MRGRLRSKKIFSPLKLILFLVVFSFLSNLFPSELINPSYERRTFKTFTWLSVKNSRKGIFDQAREYVVESVGTDVFYVLFNLGRLILAMVLKDYIADQIPYLKTKTVGQKLVKTMQMQLNEESSDEDVSGRRITEVEFAKQKKALGATGAAAATGASAVAVNLVGFVKNIISTTKMMAKFIYYILRMVLMAVFMVLNLPRQILLGTLTGLSAAGVIPEESNFHRIVRNTTFKEIFVDGVAEMFHVSDSDLTSEDLMVIGARDSQIGLNDWDSSDSEDHKCADGTCQVCEQTRPRSIVQSGDSSTVLNKNLGPSAGFKRISPKRNSRASSRASPTAQARRETVVSPRSVAGTSFVTARDMTEDQEMNDLLEWAHQHFKQ